MHRPLTCALLSLLALLAALSTAAAAFQAPGRIVRIDADRRVAVVFAAGQERTVRVAPDARILDREGKELPGGLKSGELREGAEVTLTVETEGGMPVLLGIRLGLPPAAGGGAPPPRVDTAAFKPLPELGVGEYQGFPGGLYPGGTNTRPAAHEAAGLALAKQIQPLDRDGKPSPDGKIVLLSIGMSNATQAFSTFKTLADASREKNPKLIIVDGAQGGMTAEAIQNPDDGRTGTRFWSTVDQRLEMAGAGRLQVQAVWIKEADAGPTQGFPGYARKLQEELGRIARVLRVRFPHLKLAYLSSRTYGGYARTRLNPEPYAYESGFSVKWLIEQQLGGDPSLNFDPAKGPVQAPWLSWGPYLWANSTRKSADGLFYEESDFAGDGTHPSRSGQQKVAGQLWKFFSTDSTARGWFLTP